jgi:hypothetical protein
LSELEV